MHAASIFRFERCFGDKEGQVWTSLGVKSLPALVLVNEEGYIIARFEGDDLNGEIVSEAFDDLARAGRLKGKPVRDFKLPRVESGELMTLLDVAERDYIMLVFLNSSSSLCYMELQELQRIRDRYNDLVSLVAIFQDSSDSETMFKYLNAYGIEVDFAFRDPGLTQATGYHFGFVPVLIVVGPDGRIVYSLKGYQPEKFQDLAALMARFTMEREIGGSRKAFREARRIYTEALQYLQEGRPEMAVMFLERIIETNPGLTTTHGLIGQAYETLGRHQEAAQHYMHYITAHLRAYDIDDVKERLRVQLDRITSTESRFYKEKVGSRIVAAE
jgi:tetratricopeptide (TPR) repeat protein